MSKTVNGVTTYFLYNGGILLAEVNSSGQLTRFYNWGAMGLVSDRQIGGLSQFYLYDHSGNTRALVNPFGTLLSRGAYSAWGASYGGLVPNSPHGWNGRYGVYRDSESGLLLMGHRYYAPALGRFLSRDPIGIGGGLNVYAYCGDDPINLSDPLGLAVEGDSDNYLRNSTDYNPLVHLGVNTLGVAKDMFWPPTIYHNLAGLAENFGNVSGRYDSGKASMGEVVLAGTQLAAGMGGTALTVYGAGKAGLNALSLWRNGGCFVAGTLVQVAVPDRKSKNGYRLVTKPIEQMKQGDLVASRDEKTGKTSFKKVLETTVRTVEATLDVTLADAKTGQVVEVVTTTRNHPFSVRDKGFVPAGGLAIGNAIVTRAGPDIVVAKVEWRRRAEGYQVYNFEVEDDHTYFVGKANGGVWVHNPNCPVNFAQFRRGQLREHYDEHGKEFPGLSQNQYMQAAKDFAKEEGDFMETIVENLFYIKYDHVTRRLFVGNIKQKEIRTFYIADDRHPDPFFEAIIESVNRARGGR